MKTLVKRFLKDQSGATAIEYGLIAAGISVAIITVVKNVGTSLNSTFTTVQTGLNPWSSHFLTTYEGLRRHAGALRHFGPATIRSDRNDDSRSIEEKTRQIAIISFSVIPRTSDIDAAAGAALATGEIAMMVLKRLMRDESGATAIEYGLIAAGIAVAILVVVQNVGTSLNSTFTSVQTGLNP
jgi:pilus assembly protein Flp/PilA